MSDLTAKIMEVVARLKGEVPSAPAAPGSADLDGRVRAFRHQVDEWAASGRAGVPVLTLPGAPMPQVGRCVSCGAALEPGRTWRCVACLCAVELTLGLPPEADP